jgi:hypothetical protein
LIGTVFQLPSPDAIYSRDEEKKTVDGYPVWFGLARGPHALGSRGEATRLWVFCERPDSPLAEVTGTVESSIAIVNMLYSDVCDVSGVGEAVRKPVFGVFRDFLELKLSSA